MKTQFLYFILLDCFLEIEKISLVDESQIMENFRLFPGNKPLDQFSWIKFRSPILSVWSFLQSFSFVCLPSCSQPAGKVFPLEPHPEATRNFSGPKKNPRAYFDPLHLCTKFHPKISTLSTSNPQAKNPPKIKFGYGWSKLIF